MRSCDLDVVRGEATRVVDRFAFLVDEHGGEDGGLELDQPLEDAGEGGRMLVALLGGRPASPRGLHGRRRLSTAARPRFVRRSL